MFQGMAANFYALHYQERISPRLSEAEKLSIANRISALTLKAPIWMDSDKDFATDFPELKPFVNVQLSGLYLCTILQEIVYELGGIKKY